MTVHPSTTSLPKTRYVEDLFLHLRGRSRRVQEARAAVVAAPTPWNVDDELVHFENVVSDFCASVARAVVAQLHEAARIAPGYVDEEQDALTNLGPAAVDELVRPIFEACGILEDFVAWREVFPRLAAEEAAAASS